MAKKISKTKAKSKKTLWQFLKGKKIAILLVLVLLFVGYKYISKKNSKIEVETAKVSKSQVINSLVASGKVDAQKKVSLTFQTSGKVSYVGASEGDQIKKGQVIASLDKKILESELKKLLNTWSREFSEFDDSNKLIEDSVLTDSVRRIKSRAQIDLDQTQIDIEIKNEVLRLATIYAPYDGVLTSANPTVSGINTSPATASYTLVDPKSMYFSAEVSETDIPSIYPDQEVLIHLDSYSETSFKGKVEFISLDSTVTSTGGTAYKVHISIPNDDTQRLRLGMNGDGEFIFERKENTLTIPESALFEESGSSFVWKITNGRANKQAVQLGISSNEFVEIIDGLEESDEVVVSAPPRPDSKLKDKKY